MPTTDLVVLTAHLAATAAMTGLIWFVQVVHYPLFAAVGAGGFAAYERAHQQRTSLVVGPLMGLEGATAVWLVFQPPTGLGSALPLIALGTLGGVHASTVLLQVPAHARLSSGADPGVILRLVRTNWIRTVGWTVRAVLASVMLVAAV